MEQLTLEQSATNYAPLNAQKKERDAFKAGAKWQKEQYNRILQLAFNAANELDSLGAISLCDHIKTELEKLESL